MTIPKYLREIWGWWPIEPLSQVGFQATINPRQAYDGEQPRPTLKKELQWEYLLLNTYDNRQLGFKKNSPTPFFHHGKIKSMDIFQF